MNAPRPAGARTGIRLPGRGPRLQQELAQLRRRPSFVIAFVIVVWWLLAALAWRALGLDPLADSGVALALPSAEHLLGTDSLGRDVWARVLAGSEPAMKVGAGGAILGTVLGSILGIAAGYAGGKVDTLIMRSLDLFLALPTLILLFVLAGAFGVSTPALILIIGIVFAPSTARIIRAAVLVEVGKDYLVAARLQHESLGRILVRELLPNVAPTIVVQATLSFAGAIFMTASLSFLGLGSTPPTPDWALDINVNRAYLQSAWWVVLSPALAVASLVISAHLLADNITEVRAR